MDRTLAPKPTAPPPSSKKTPAPTGRSPKTVAPRLVFPGATAWETWIIEPTGAKNLGNAATPALSPQTGSTPDLALPVRRVFSIPLWLATTDKSLLRGMIGLQLERRGFGTDGQNAAWEFTVIKTQGERTLVLVAVLPPNLPDELQWDRVRLFSVSARCLPLPVSSVVVWAELNGLALAVTLGSEIVYWQQLSGTVETVDRAQEIELVLASLELQDIVPARRLPLHLWFACPEAELQALQASHGGPVKVEPRPAPRPATNDGIPVPLLVRTARVAATRAALLRRYVLGGVAIYLLAMTIWSVWVGTLLWQRHTLQQEIQAGATTVLQLQRTAQRWDALETAIQPDSFAAELLYQCHSALPPDGLRLTTFGIDNNKVTLVGEAKNATAPYEYETALKNLPALTAYRWSSTPPRQLPSGSWQFTLEATRSSRAATK